LKIFGVVELSLVTLLFIALEQGLRMYSLKFQRFIFKFPIQASNHNINRCIKELMQNGTTFSIFLITNFIHKVDKTCPRKVATPLEQSKSIKLCHDGCGCETFIMA
jgi:hypothetical protein